MFTSMELATKLSGSFVIVLRIGLDILLNADHVRSLEEIAQLAPTSMPTSNTSLN